MSTSSQPLQDGQAHVWTVPLDSAPSLPPTTEACLSPAERARAERIADPLMRRRYVMTRTALRALLSGCTRFTPASLELRRSEQGKPFIAARVGVDFSISHSRGVALIAVSTSATGVDIEHVRRPLHLDRTARRILHEDTVALLEASTEAGRVLRFIDAWTLREAHVKAVGGGLFRTPDTVPYDPSLPADGNLHVVQGRDRVTWSVARFGPGDDTRAAVVLRGAGHTLHVHDAAATLQLIEEVFHERN